MDFAVNMGFAHTAGNQLRDLGAEIENEDFGVAWRDRDIRKRKWVKKKARKRATLPSAVELALQAPPWVQ